MRPFRMASLRSSLLRDSISSGVIQAVNRIVALALSVILARGLGSESYGIYAYAFAVMSLVMLFAELGVPTLLVREVAANHGRREWGLLRGVLIRGGQFVTAASLSVAVIGILALYFRRKELGDEEFYTLLVMFAMLPVTALGRAAGASLRGLHRVLLGQSVEMVLRPVLALCFVSVIFALWPNLREANYAMGAQFVAALAVLAAGALLVSRHLPEGIRGVQIRALDRDWMRSALTFALIAGAGIINTQVDVIMLGWFREPVDVGVYRVAAQSAVFAAFAMQAASAVLAPRFSILYRKGDVKALGFIFQKASIIIGSFSIVIFFLFILLGRDILHVIFGSEYLDSSVPLSILAAGYSVNALCGPVGLLLQMAGREAMTARVLWGTAVLNIMLNSALIPLFGTIGAASATACSVALYHVILRLKAWKIFGI